MVGPHRERGVDDFMQSIDVAGRRIGTGERPYLIAEIGSNHNGDMDLCRHLIDAAAEAGADAVKFQSWSESSLVSRGEYARNTAYEDAKRHFGSLREMVEAYQFTETMHREAAAHCRERGVTFLSTPFAPEEVRLLEELEVPLYKVASMDVNHPVLLHAIAATGKPVVLSTGMASLGEVEAALGHLRDAGAGRVALLHCVSIYPPEPETIHLRNIPMLRTAFDVPVGFSDHTIGVTVPIAAMALGACIVEKHFTLDKDMAGWDHAISADPDEFARLARDADLVGRAVGGSVRVVSPAERAKREKFRRRIVLRRKVSAGETLSLDDLDFKRPGTGIDPDRYEEVVGRSVKRDLEADHELEFSDLA